MRNTLKKAEKSFWMLLLLALVLVSGVQAQTLEGTVVDASGQPMAGVTMFLDGTTRGDISDSEGRFTITARQPGGYLLVGSHVGYETIKREVLLREGETLTITELVMRENVVELGEVVVEALPPKKWQRYLRIFEEDVLGRTRLARKAHLVNPEVLSFERIRGGFKAEASAPLVVENPATGYRIRVFMERYEHHNRTGCYRLASRLLFEEMGAPDEKQLKARERLYRGSMQHFLWAWYHGRVAEEDFFVHGSLDGPQRLGEVGYAARPDVILVEYGARPDGIYRSLLSRHGGEPPFSKERQVSRIAFQAGLMRVASNGHPIGEVRQEGYWAFAAGVGDAVPSMGVADDATITPQVTATAGSK